MLLLSNATTEEGTKLPSVSTEPSTVDTAMVVLENNASTNGIQISTTQLNLGNVKQCVLVSFSKLTNVLY